MNPSVTGRPWPENPADSIVTGKYKVRRRRRTYIDEHGDLVTTLRPGWVITSQYDDEMSRTAIDFATAIDKATALADQRQRRLMDEIHAARAERHGLVTPLPTRPVDHASYFHTLVTVEEATV